MITTRVLRTQDRVQSEPVVQASRTTDYTATDPDRLRHHLAALEQVVSELFDLLSDKHLALRYASSETFRDFSVGNVEC